MLFCPRLGKFDLSRFAILLIAILVIFINLNTKPWRKGRVIHDDVISYYCYLPAAIIHHDLTFQFTKSNPEFYGDKYWPLKTFGGRDVVKMTMGLAILYLPFFLLGHLLAVVGGYSLDGYSLPYLISLQFSAVFYLIMGLILLRKVLRRWFSSKVIAIVMFSTIIGTNMLHYSTLEATMSHVYSFFLFSLFFFLTVRFWEKPSVKLWILIALIAGLISLVRPTNMVIILFFLLWDVSSVDILKKRLAFFLHSWQYILLSLLIIIVVWFPQLLYWKIATGSWFYYSYNDEGFFFLKPHILNGLLSYRKGWLLYSPVMVFPVVGIIMLAAKRRFDWFWPVSVFFLVNIYIVFSWWSWWYGGGLGARPLIESYALLVLPFAFVLSWTEEKITTKIIGYTILVLFTLYGFTANFQYRYGAIHWDSMTKASYWDSFLRLHPSGRFNYLLQTPDYNSAKVGKDESFLKSSYQLKLSHPIFICNCDIPQGNGFFAYVYDSTEMSSGGIVNDAMSHTGSYSVMVNRNNQFGLSTDISLKPNTRYIAEAWRKGNPNAMLVVNCSEVNFYISTNKTVEIDSCGWEHLVLEFTTPDVECAFPCKVYVWNPERRKAYFDDMKLGEIVEKY